MKSVSVPKEGFIKVALFDFSNEDSSVFCESCLFIVIDGASSF